MVRAAVVALVVAFSSLCAPVSAWWDGGHMMTAAVAEANLHPEIRGLVTDRLVALSGVYGYSSGSLVSSAHWMDDLKEEGISEFNSMHFTNIPYSGDGTVCPQPDPSDDTIIKALQLQTTQLQLPDLRGAIALRFIAHLLGDLHQPLHCVSRCSAVHPKGDLGGNLFSLGNTTRFSNLHSFWDAMGGQYKDVEDLCPYGDRATCATNEGARVTLVRQKAAEVMAEFPPDLLLSAHEAHALSAHRAGVEVPTPSFSFEAWADEGFTMAAEVYGGLMDGEAPNEAYTAAMKTTTRRRVAMGGYRMALVLNEALLGASPAVVPGGGGEGASPGLVAGLGALAGVLGCATMWLCAYSCHLREKQKKGESSFEEM